MFVNNSIMKKTILASASPRRKELIASLPIQIVSIIPAQNELPYQKRLSPEQNVAAISAAKAENVSKIAAGTEYDLIIAADTIVVIDDRVLGKPRDGMEAISMLSCLSGRTHQVYTGVTILSKDRKISFAEKTDVTFNLMSGDEILDYVKSGEPMDKAGAYGIQGKAKLFIKEIRGSYENVIGLPVAELYRVLSAEQLI